MKTVIEMVRESWLDTYGLGKDHASFVEALEHFAALVRADEREACMNALNALPYQRSTKYDCMDAIRARGETK